MVVGLLRLHGGRAVKTTWWWDCQDYMVVGLSRLHGGRTVKTTWW